MGDTLARALATRANAYADGNRYGSFIVPRHSKVASSIATTVLQGVAVGDSICNGTGASDYNHNWLWLLGTKLQAAFGSTVGAWAPVNNGVGSTTVEQCLAYLSHTLDANATVSPGPAYSYPYWILMTGRNDCTVLGLAVFSKLYRTAVRMGIRAGIDVVCVTEQPKVDMTTGQVADPGYAAFASEIRRIAGQEGASLVDVQQEWLYQQSVGVDLRSLTTDGTHPSDAGHAIIADLIYRCLSMPSSPVVRRPTTQEDVRLGYYVLSQYNINSSSLTSLVNPAVTTTSTSRGRATGTQDAIQIASGGYVVFRVPNCRIEYVVVTVIFQSGAGTLTVESPWAQVISNNLGATGGIVREYSTAIAGNQSVPSAETVRLVATGGNVQVTGVHVICSPHTAAHDTVRGTESGVWADAASQSLSWRSTATVGNTITVNWYGTDLSVDLETGTSLGVVGYQTDGGAAGTFDCYANAANAIQRKLIAFGLAKGWHSTVFTVQAKNASSTGNTVNIRNLRAYCPVGVDGSVVAMCGPGVTVYAREGVTFARAQSGIPVISGSTVTNSSTGIIETTVK